MNKKTKGYKIYVTGNKGGYAILEACKKCDKAILLTATPFINKLYDIENLLSMVDKKQPLNQNNFYKMITNTESRLDYFNYKISHNENSSTQYFPEKIEETFNPLKNLSLSATTFSSLPTMRASASSFSSLSTVRANKTPHIIAQEW